VRALLDEQLSPEIARALRARGLDVQAISERHDLAERSDEQVLEVAFAEGRAVVTNNIKDYRPIAARRLADGSGHHGLILLPARRSRARAATGALAGAIETIMRSNPDGIANSERWIAPFS
jgi:hypothetical protein